MFEKGLEQLAAMKVIPVIALNDAKDAKPLAEALCAGGLPAAEITFRTAAAEESIRITAKEFPNMMVGAGSLINVDQAKRARDAGATFFVSAGFSGKIAQYAIDNDIPYYPGVCTPTEIVALLEYDLPVAKFFPAAQYGGLNTIKALAAPFPQLKFMPTGGVSASNILEYLAFDKIIACGGSWMVKGDFIKNGEFDKIEALSREAVELVKGVNK
ncbi:MAG: bifunctional 4-hydroxy-2-oxoglutarate aldolase/2-dehydro-3-deoxy-phosphogluconate aldolase [Oscillospiraceae bacterium]